MHKFDAYHGSPAWHFTRTDGERDKLERRVEVQLRRDYRSLRAQLRSLNATIELWEEDWTRPRSRERRPRPEPAPYHDVFRHARRTKDVPPRKNEPRGACRETANDLSVGRQQARQ